MTTPRRKKKRLPPSTVQAALTDFETFRAVMRPLPATQLRQLRAKLRLTQAQLAEQLGVTRNTVNRWEMGLHPIPVWATKLIRLITEKHKKN